MSYEKRAFLTCDDCGVVYPGSDRSVRELRYQARGNGWVFRYGPELGQTADFCARCAR